MGATPNPNPKRRRTFTSGIPPAEAEQQIRQLRALGEYTRYRIIALLLANEGLMTVYDLADELSAEQSSISQHLRVLRSARLVYGRKVRQSVYYSVRHKALRQVAEGILALIPAREQSEQKSA